MKKENRGGKREGAGRKKGIKTKTVSFRVPVKWVYFIKIAVNKEIKKLKTF